MEIKAEHRTIEIIEEHSLYIFDVLQNNIEKLLPQNEFFKFKDKAEIQKFAHTINFNKISTEKFRNEVMEKVQNKTSKKETIELFNSMFFGIIEGQYFLTISVA
jgi:hypothetical protein